ncbi:MAG: hypothetical protein IJH70_09450 [Oscillospiraceae bacterium]|nr:hypothetical protein [Oscillospiraceae bacterium]
MKHSFFKKLLSLLLVMTLIFSLGLTAAFADESEETISQVKVTVDETNGTVKVEDTASGENFVKKENDTTVSVAVENKEDGGQSSQTIENAQSVTVEVNNNVSGEGSVQTTDVPGSKVVVYIAESNSEDAPAVTVDLNDHNVSAGSDSTGGVIYGIYTDGSNVTVTEVGTVTATVTNNEVKDTSDNSPSAQAVVAKGGSTVNVNTVQATGYEAAAVRGYSGSEINVEGTAAATAVNRALAVDANYSGTKIEVNKAEATSTGVGSAATAIQVENATVNAGSATATANGTATAVSAEGDKTVVTVKNDVTAKALAMSNSATAVSADEGAAVTAGSVTATAGQYSTATAVSAAGGASVTADSAYASAFRATAVSIKNSSDQVSTVSINNETKAIGALEATAVDAGKESSGNRVNVTVGSATAETVLNKDNAAATAVNAAGDKTVVTVNEEVKATSNGGTATGIKAADGASVTAGSVEAVNENGLAIAVSVVASDPEKPTSVIVREDVQSSETGVQVDLVPDAKKADAVVEIGGTLKVDEGGTPVLIGSGVTEDNIAITVWKVEIDGQQAKEGEIVKPADENATDEQKAAAKAVEESIQYIIQIKPEQLSNIRSSKATAKANETFTVTVTPPDGKKLDAVYTDEGEKIEATLNDDGTYSVTVRVGGGMLLSAKFSDKPVDPAPAPVPVPVPPAVDTGTAAANDWAAATVRLVPENGAYTVTLTTRVPTMTFLRQTLEKFAKYNDRLVIDTPYGSCEISLAELLNFNEKAVNFRIVVTSTALEIYVNGELFRSIPLSDLT